MSAHRHAPAWPRPSLAPPVVNHDAAGRAAPGMDILVIEDHPMMASSVHACLRTLRPEAGIVVVGSLSQALALARRRGPPRLVVTDLNLPDADGLATLTGVQSLAPHAALVVFSAFVDDTVAEAARHMGAHCVVSKSSLTHNFVEEISRLLDSLDASRSASPPRGETSHAVQALSRRQHTVLTLLAQGHSNREIAESLTISETTVCSHVAEVFHRLGVQNRTQAGALYLTWAHENGVAL